MAELFIREIAEGMEDPAGGWGEQFTDIRAGVIKVGTSTYMTPAEHDINRAAALASSHTGGAIIAHTTCGGGLEEAEWLLACGAHPDRVIIGHQGDRDDREQPEALDYHRRLADLGCFLAFDRIGMSGYDLPKQARQVADLIARGHLSQLLLGHDRGAGLVPDPEAIPKTADLWSCDDEGFATVTTDFVRVLKEYNIAEDQINAMLVGNPRRALAF
jgi:predicted metal-dependent phosphotriesterase family hydrolase